MSMVAGYREVGRRPLALAPDSTRDNSASAQQTHSRLMVAAVLGLAVWLRAERKESRFSVLRKLVLSLSRAGTGRSCENGRAPSLSGSLRSRGNHRADAERTASHADALSVPNKTLPPQ